MAKINLGTASIDLDRLIVQRLLVQASSGGGKSWAIRRLVEQAFGKIQIIIIDPEGEFATLREKFDFVLASKGGDTPADARSAALLATKLLELGASAVCDLYEMNPLDRHRWVGLFLDSLVNAPKELWHPVLVIIDEAHVFCPEKGKGDSEARGAVLGLISRGRKRGFCAVLATQRLAKLDKDAAAELLNVMIGRTILDVDRDRAAEALGIRRSDKEQFHATVRSLPPGDFFVLGPAFPESAGAQQMKVGVIQTTHPESGSAKAAHKPATPEKIKSLLPKLEDLPKAAEEKARTEADLRNELHNLRTQLTIAQKAAPVVDEGRIARELETALHKQSHKFEGILRAAVHDDQRLRDGITDIIRRCTLLLEAGNPIAEVRPFDRGGSLHVPEKSIQMPPMKQIITSVPLITTKPNGHMRHEGSAPDLSGPEKRILNAIAWMESIGISEPEQTAVAFLAGYTTGGGAYNNPRGRLNQRGYIRYISGDKLALTDEGRVHATAPLQALDKDELQKQVMERLPGPEQKILRVLLESYPSAVSNEECALKSGYTAGGGAFNNPRGRLRTLGLIDYPSPGMLTAKPLLFLES